MRICVGLARSSCSPAGSRTARLSKLKVFSPGRSTLPTSTMTAVSFRLESVIFPAGPRTSRLTPFTMPLDTSSALGKLRYSTGTSIAVANSCSPTSATQSSEAIPILISLAPRFSVNNLVTESAPAGRRTIRDWPVPSARRAGSAAARRGRYRRRIRSHCGRR